MEITAKQIIEKRKELWEQYENINKDYEFTISVANELLHNQPLLEEIKANPYLLI